MLATSMILGRAFIDEQIRCREQDRSLVVLKKNHTVPILSSYTTNPATHVRSAVRDGSVVSACRVVKSERSGQVLKAR